MVRGRAIIVNGDHRDNYYKQKEVVTCANEGCDVKFIPHMKTQRFCSRKCQRSFSDGWRRRELAQKFENEEQASD